MSGLHRTGIRTTLATLPLVVGLLAATATPAGAGVPHPRTSLTCRGAGVDPDARVRHRAETVIDAPLRTVWNLQTDVESWPSWQTPVTAAQRLDHGPLRRGSAFRWTTPVPPNPTPATSLEITSTVEQLGHHTCVRWTGPATGEGLHIDGIHVWNFTRTPGGGVRVSTEETHTGPQVDADVPTATAILRQGLEGWLSDLKATAEARTHDRPH
ncbi:polyketide cyclase /reductase [Streptomyces venezuelae]|uniref:Polyketide cyclase /reductase n=1 Tax=Streptomyces venezuelae TaxID=54571 RepID=A0A5P2DVA9_STRVZ|nr:SRPBCC family protein [Streptomyces venezuelae]QES58410.1 polyketide cyclase /reductase [Streptomyces venezuelae]